MKIGDIVRIVQVAFLVSILLLVLLGMLWTVILVADVWFTDDVVTKLHTSLRIIGRSLGYFTVVTGVMYLIAWAIKMEC